MASRTWKLGEPSSDRIFRHDDAQRKKTPLELRTWDAILFFHIWVLCSSIAYWAGSSHSFFQNTVESDQWDTIKIGQFPLFIGKPYHSAWGFRRSLCERELSTISLQIQKTREMLSIHHKGCLSREEQGGVSAQRCRGSKIVTFRCFCFPTIQQLRVFHFFAVFQIKCIE